MTSVPRPGPRLSVLVETPGFWSPALPGWDVARAAFRGEGSPVEGGARRPSPALLPPAERRRVPDPVAAALQAAAEAVAAADADAAGLPSVFTSAYGDLAGTDALCAELARPSPLLSPTRFHNAVHNAAAGYWCIATGCQRASSAVAADRRSFAAGLLEAATLCVAEDTPVLLVAFDGEAAGPLASVASSTGLMALAVVLRPAREGAPGRRLDVAIAAPGDASPGLALPAARSDAARALAGNAMADALPLGEALAQEAAAAWHQPLSDHASLALRLAAAPSAPDRDPT